jgi:REP element-mobilizing transposase RayT
LTSESRKCLESLWEKDGLRPLEWEWAPERIRILFSTRPDVFPVFLCQRAKGRLQHALRQEGTPVSFSRKVACDSVGNPNEPSVDRYLRDQLDGGDFADPKYRETLATLAFTNPDVKATCPQETSSGRYVFALHVVLVTADRVRLPSEQARKVRGSLEGMGGIARAAMMPDHLHVAVKGDPGRSPSEIVEEIREQTGRGVGTLGLWMSTSYVGTFGSYGMAAIRKRVREVV